MAYSNRFVKGALGYTGNWPLIVIERAKSDKPLTPVLSEVFGFEHESGSVYLKDIRLATDIESWKNAVRGQGHNPDDRYFKGDLLIVGTVASFAQKLGIDVLSF